MATIYMPLLNEGVDVWRPIEATPVSQNAYRVEGEMPDDEVWTFAPGTVVCCSFKTFSSGQCGLVAISLAE